MRNALAFAVLFLALLARAEPYTGPSVDFSHGPLRVSDNHRFLVHADGTPFFGSPTKLFEYMAIGKGIVASNLGQIGQVLEHGRTAWLVAPGDIDALVDGLERLIGDAALRSALGAEARREVVARYTWHEHTRRTIARLQEIVGAATDGRRSVAHA